MTIQTLMARSLVYPISACHPSCFFVRQPYFATSLDYGFDFDEDELARELSAPLPIINANQPAHPVEAEEFDRFYRWFNS